MSTVTTFDTRSVHHWNDPQSDASAEVKFPRSFVAPPRLPYGLRELDISNKTNLQVEAKIDDISKTSAVYHINSPPGTLIYTGIVDSLNLAPANMEFLTGEHTRHSKDSATVRINFERPFVTPPKVVAFFNLINLDRNKNWRLKTYAKDIDTKGFTLHIETWGDTILQAARACWVAYPEDREHIFSASVNTMEVRPWDKPAPKASKAIKFGNVEFWKNPEVFVGFNWIDVDCKTNFRVNAYVDGVTQGGLTWHIDSWSDTVVYSAGATIVAVN